MVDDIVGSHFKSQRGRGQNQDLTPSSTREKSLPPIPVVGGPNASPVNANAADDAKRLGKIMGKPIAAHSGTVQRGVDSGSPGGPVPHATIRRDSGKR